MHIGKSHVSLSVTWAALFFPVFLIHAQQYDTWISAPMPAPASSDAYVYSMVNDPVRPPDYYAFSSSSSGTPIHVSKSTDYGATWKVIYSGGYNGAPWGVAIDQDSSRNPSTPPTLYSCAGYGSLGLLKSIDGGVTWTQKNPGNAFSAYTPYPNDIYSVTVLPDDPPDHIIVTYHGQWWDYGSGDDAGLAESFDGGETWTAHLPPAGFGQSSYILAISATTWIALSQWNGNTYGVWRTTTAGRINNAPSPSAWARVGNIEHAHGTWQGYYDAAHNAAYISGVTTNSGNKFAIWRSLDNGATWTNVYTAGHSTYLIGTPNFIYSCYEMGTNNLRAPASNATSWTSLNNPSGMTGTLGAGTPALAKSFNGTNWVIVGALVEGHVWRLVESAQSTATDGFADQISRFGLSQHRGISVLTDCGLLIQSSRTATPAFHTGYFDLKGRTMKASTMNNNFFGYKQ